MKHLNSLFIFVSLWEVMYLAEVSSLIHYITEDWRYHSNIVAVERNAEGVLMQGELFGMFYWSKLVQ